jgi:hypothetical protein
VRVSAFCSALSKLSDKAWATIEPHLPHGRPGKPRVDDRRVIYGVLHILKWIVGGAEPGKNTGTNSGAWLIAQARKNSDPIAASITDRGPLGPDTAGNGAG